MTYLTKKQIADLASFHDAFCISIYIPTHRSGQSVLEGKDMILLKNQLKEVKNKLELQGLSETAIDQKLTPIRQLIKDKAFWKYQEEGLAIFLANGFVQKYTLPISFEPKNYVANNFYLKPLLPMLVGDGRFFLLALELGDVHLYEGNRDQLTEVSIPDLTPTRLEEVVGTDYKPSFLQFRSQQEGHGAATFHGHGEGKDDRKKEITNFLRAVHKGLMTRLHDEHLPMVVACQQYLFPMYKKVNTYPHLINEPILGSPSNIPKASLKEQAWATVKVIFDRERQQKMEQFEQFQGTSRASSDQNKVLSDALMGKVDTLFLQEGIEVWGKYDPAKGISLAGKRQLSDVSLTNLAAIKVFLQGGKVYLLEKGNMPATYSAINALYHY